MKNKGFVLLYTTFIFTFIFIIVSGVFLSVTISATTTGVYLASVETKHEIEQIGENYINLRNDIYSVYSDDYQDITEEYSTTKVYSGKYRIEVDTLSDTLTVYSDDELVFITIIDFTNHKITEWKYYK